MGSGPSRSSSESHLSENGNHAGAAQHSTGSKKGVRHRETSQRNQGTENSKKDDQVVPQSTHAKLATQSTISKKEQTSPHIKNRSEISHGGDDSMQAVPLSNQNSSGILQGGNSIDQQDSAGPSLNAGKAKKFTSGMSLTAQGQSSSEVLVKMGSSMIRTKNCSEEFQSLDLGEPIVMGKFDHDKSRPLHTLALERYCLVESSSVSGFSNATESAAERKQTQPPIAPKAATDSCLLRLSEGLPLFWLHATSAADMRRGSDELRAAGYESATIFICAADPVIFARPYEEKKSAQADAGHYPTKKNVFFCLPALVRAAPPSRSLYVPGRLTLAQLERDIKMSIVHLVAQDVTSNGHFPAYFGSTTTSQDAMSIGWTLGKIHASFADEINTALAAAIMEFEMIKPRISRIQIGSSANIEGSCLDESEINTLSKALLMNYYEKLSQTRHADGIVAMDTSPVFEESGPVARKTAVVVVTYEDLSTDSCFVLLLAGIAVTLQQEPTPVLYRKLFEEVPPLGLNAVIRSFVTLSNPIAGHFDEFITQMIGRLFKGNTAASANFVSTNHANIIRYTYTFLFSYYCYDIFVKRSSPMPFSKWLRRHYLCYRSLAALSAPIADILELAPVQAPIYLILESDGVPIMSIVSSDFGVKAHGFRKIPPAPVYGSQSPSDKELMAIVDYCAVIGKRWRHTVVVWCDLRPNPVIYIDGKPHLIANGAGFSVTDDKVADSGADLEHLEEYFKNNLFTSILPVFAKRTGGVVTPIIERKDPPTLVQTPREFAANLHQVPRPPVPEFSTPRPPIMPEHIVYYRLPTYDEKAPSEEVLQRLVEIVLSQQSIYVDEDGPAFLFTCASGVGAVTVMMIAATLITYHLNGFPFGCHVGEEERVSIKNVQYTQGNFQAVRELVEQIPRGNQVKREVDAVLDACWDRMTSTFYHLREIIFATFSKVFTVHEETASSNHQPVEAVYKQSVDYLERYVLLIVFNAYLHAKKHEPGGWQTNTFQDWLAELAASDNQLIATLDNLCFQEFGDDHLAGKCRRIRDRWLCGTTLSHEGDS